ncbi:MAG: dienelactone hydrolase family protein [Chloroflexi bacterium]|nr:dienelactone hydrolase family protein [Chloroflexota bacterium]
MFEASRPQYHIVSGYIQIVSEGQYLPAFWSHPEMGGPFPGLMLLHDFWGLTPHIRSQVRRYAELGYYVIAPDLFNRQTATSAAQANALVSQVGDAAPAHVAAALHALRSHNRCDNNVGIIGWGMGAQLGLQTAMTSGDLRLLMTFYGLPNQIDVQNLDCPVLALFAEGDTTVPPEAISALRQALTQAKVEHEVVVYPKVERGFFDDSSPTFHPVAAMDAWNRSLELLAQHLDAPTPPDTGSFFPGRVY